MKDLSSPIGNNIILKYCSLNIEILVIRGVSSIGVLDTDSKLSDSICVRANFASNVTADCVEA